MQIIHNNTQVLECDCKSADSITDRHCWLEHQESQEASQHHHQLTRRHGDVDDSAVQLMVQLQQRQINALTRQSRRQRIQ